MTTPSVYSDPIKEIRDFIKNFDPAELLNFITITAALPGNEIYCPRLETLFKITISIRAKKFKNSKLTNKNVDELLTKLDSLYSWQMLEDFIPVSLFDYPPIWIMGNRFRIFAGVQDSAYEYWKELVSDYFSLRSHFKVYGYDPISLIFKFLKLETELVSLLEDNVENYRKWNKISIPSFELANKWKTSIEKWYKENPYQDFLKSHEVTLGRKLSLDKIIEKEPLDTIYKFYAINANGVNVPIFQHCIFGFLNSLFIQNLKELNSKDTTIGFDNDTRLYRRLILLFNRKNIFHDFSIKGSSIINFAVIFDFTKLFLFKIIDGDFCGNVDEEIERSLNNIQKIDNKISQGERSFLIDNKIEGIFLDVPIEVIPILLVKSALPSVMGIRNDNSYVINKTMWFGPFVDFLFLADDIESGMRLLKYLRRENELDTHSKIMVFSNLDKYAWYASNNDSFIQSGQVFGAISIMPGIWNDYFLKKLKQKPNFQPRYDSDEPDDYWDVKVIRDNVYQVANPISKNIAGIFRVTSDRLIWILTTIGVENYHPDELRSFNLLTQLIPHRITKNSTFEILLNELGITQKDRFSFVLRPTSVIFRHKYSHMQSLANSVSEKNPIVVDGSIDPKTGKTVFFVVYSTEYLTKLFENNSLLAEKRIIETILRALILRYNKSQKTTEELVKSCLDQLFEDALPSFNFSMHKHKLYLPNSSDHYLKTLDSDISEVQRMTFIHLKNQSVAFGTYEGEEAKKIIDEILSFLNKKIEERISAYDLETILLFGLNVGGNLIQAREIWRNRTIMDLVEIRELDPKQNYREVTLEISKISNSVRYLLEKSLQISPNGKSFLTEENWLELQAFGESFIQAMMVRNTIYHGIGIFQLKINENYSYVVEDIDIKGLTKHSENYDFELLKPPKSAINWNSDQKSVEQFFNELNPAFEDEFGTGFQDFLKVLDSCTALPIENGTHTILTDEDDLISYIKGQRPELTKEKITNALKLGSLSKDDFNLGEIYATDIRNRKARLLAKPIPVFEKNGSKVYVLNSWLIDVSINRWLVNIDQGYLLFKEDLINSGMLKTKLKEMQQRAANKHEKAIEEIVNSKTKYYDINVKENKKCFVGLPEPCPGEIDNISLYPSRCELFIIEAKNLLLNLSPQEIYNEIEKYIEEETGFFAKLIKKKNFVLKYLDNILQYYKIQTNKENWKIRCLIVTHTVPFSIPNDTEIEIIHIDDLRNKLS